MQSYQEITRMNIQVKNVTEKSEWEQYVLAFSEANFLQSFNWGEFHQRLGKQVVRLAFFNEHSQVVGLSAMVYETARRGNYISIAGGPLCNWNDVFLVKTIFEEIEVVARQLGAQFIRFRPQAIDSLELRAQLQQLGMVESPMHVTADLTLQLDLSLSEDELLMQMRKNTRSAIRKAQKESITVETSTDPNDIREFYDIQLAVAQKQGFVPFSYDFLHTQFEVFNEDNQVMLFKAYQEGVLLASAFVLFYNSEAVYHYGVSTPENARLPGSYACQWAAILEAKNRGCSKYNFWGIAPEEATNHRFSGVSLFKRGFGGQEVEYLHAFDKPLSQWYKIISFFELMRKRIRRL